jgi:hypothetical protein
LVTAGAGVICLAPVAQADETAPDAGDATAKSTLSFTPCIRVAPSRSTSFSFIPCIRVGVPTPVTVEFQPCVRVGSISFEPCVRVGSEATGE